MEVIKINGRHVFQTTANIIEISTNGISWITVYNKASGGLKRGFVIEFDGWLRVTEGTQYDHIVTSEYKNFYFKALV